MQKKDPVYNYHYSSQGHWQTSWVLQVRRWKGWYLQGGADGTGVLILTSEVFHAMHVILSLKLGDHDGLDLFVHGRLLRSTLLVVLPTALIQIPTHTSLSPVPVCCWGQSRTSWCCLAAAGGMPAPQHPTPGKSVLVFIHFALFLLLLILLVLLMLLVKHFSY